jgi:hypothetical protein
LEILRFQMQLAKDRARLKVNSYSFAVKAINEIGKLVGGWLRGRGSREPQTSALPVRAPR